MRGIFGTSDHDLWLAGTGGTIQHWDGANLTLAYQGAATQSFYAIWASGPNDVWVGGDGMGGPALVHWDGHVWSTDYSINNAYVGNVPIYAIGGSAPDQVWLLGAPGSTYFWNGTSWTESKDADQPESSNSLPPYVLRDVWSAGPGDTWAVGDDGVLLRSVSSTDAGASTPMWTKASNGAGALSLGMGDDFVGVAGSSATDVWAVSCNLAKSQTTFFHWNGSAWTASQTMPKACWQNGTSPDITHSLTVTSPSEAYCQLGTDAYHWDGTAWSFVSSSVDTGPVWSDTTGVTYGINEYQVSTAGQLEPNASLGNQVDRKSVGLDDWSPVLPDVRAWFQYVSVTAKGSVWAATYDYDSEAELVFHFTPTGWVPLAAPLHGGIQSLLAVDDDDVWISGAAVQHWNGSEWEDRSPPGLDPKGSYYASPLARDSDGTIWCVMNGGGPLGFAARSVVWRQVDHGLPPELDLLYELDLQHVRR